MSAGPGFKAVSSRKSSVGSSRKSTAAVPPIDSFDGGILAALSIQDEEENIEISRSRSSVKSKRTTSIVSQTNDMKTVDVSKALIPSDSAKENSCTPKTQTNKVHNRNAPKIRVVKSPFVDVSRSIVFSEDEDDDDDIDSADSSSENDEDNSSDDGVLENETEDADEENDGLVDDEIASEVENDDVMTDFESENNEEEESDYESEYDPNGDSEIELSEGSSDQEDSEDLSFDPDADEIRPAVLQKLGQAEVTKSEILESTPMASKKMKPHRSEVKKTKATTDKSIKIKTTKEAARNQPTTGRCVGVENNLVNDSCAPVSSLSISGEQIPEAIGVSIAESSDRNKSDSTVIVEADVDEEADDDAEYDEIVAEIVYSDDEEEPINGDSNRNDGSICAVLNMPSSMKSTANIVEHSSSEQSEVKGPPTEPTKLKDDSVCRNPVALPTSPKQLEQLNDDSLPQDAATIENKENCGVAFNHECDEHMILNRSDDAKGDKIGRSSSSSCIGEIETPCDKGIASTVLLNLSMDAERKQPASRAQDSTKSRSRVLRREGSVKPGKWKLGAKIGAGAFGVVHIGMNTCTGTLMAVKSIKMEANSMKDAEREIQLMKTLHHENIVRYLGAETDAKYLHIFQEWVPAGSVTIMLSKFGPFPVTVVQSYLMQVLQGLNYLHSNHILHRDIKGSNILVNDDGIVKLADFGASKRFVQLKQDMMMSLTMRGTPYFMAPEVFQERYSTKADIWSVGCVAIQMASGNPPWKDLELTNPVALFQHISQSSGPPDLKVTEADFTSGFRDGQNKLALFKNLVSCCFERVPEKRPCSGDLLVHSFFSEECSMSMDDSPESGLGLFNSPSPNSNIYGETMTMSPNWAANLSPILRLPIRRSNSGSGMIRSPMFSPPLPRRSTGKGANLLRSQHSPIPFSSPIPDDGEWPIWARKKSPVKRTVVEDKAAEESSVSQSNKLSGPAIVDSLVYSDDSWISSQREDFENGLSPPLAGLAFVKTPDSTVDEMHSTPTR